MAERRGIKALELWCRRMTEGYPGVKIDNMTTSWRDGLAFCAMIHHFRPDLIEFDKLNKADIYYNNELAFTTAEKYLGIPALLDAVDMAAHEVPDRLSILTYLSQFYQAFAAQDSPNRLKRPSPAGEKSQLTKTAGPPTKMAHVVGVPKRDPCKKCQLPVFLAERLAIGKKVYHRTCLKCARCGSQLTPGSFYETEVDNEYCCETCPDEEVDEEVAGASSSSVLLRSAATADDATSAATSDVSAVAAAEAKAKHSSIANRLAFFEHSGDTASATPDIRLLQKSVTDEEKTKSLKRMEATAAAAAPYKMNSALSSFLSDTIDANAEAVGDSEPSSSIDDRSATHMYTSDSESEAAEDLSMEAPPALPTTPAPEVQMRQLEAAQPPSKRYTATAKLQLAATATTTTTTTTAATTSEEPKTTNSEQFKAATLGASEAKDAEDNVPKALPTEKKKTEIQLNLATTNTEVIANQTIDNANNNNDDQLEVAPATATNIEEPHKLTQKSREINLELSATNDNDCVTKDEIADTDIIMDTDTATALSAGSTEETQPPPEQQLVLLESETVELRTKTSKSVPEQEQQQHKTEDAATTERLSVVRARLQQFEVIANKHNNNNDSDNTNAKAHTRSPDKTSLRNSSTNSPSMSPKKRTMQTVLIDETTTEPKSMPQESFEAELKPKAIDFDTVPMETSTVESVVSVETATESPSEVPLSIETKDIVENVTSKPELIIEEEKVKQPTQTMETTTPAVESKKEGDERAASNIVQSPSKIPIEEYPEDLNPFKSDDEGEEGATAVAVMNKENKEPAQQNLTLRPRTLHATPPTTASAHKSAEQLQSSNPFDSSDDEVELEKSANSSAATTPSARVPPPRPPPPRISRNPFGDEHVEEDDAMQFSRRTSLSSSLNKKTPVPTPRTNLSQSQNPTPEPTPRLSNKSAQNVLQDSSDYYSSANSLSATPASLQRNSDARGSNNSLTSSGGGTIRSRKSRKAPAPPPPTVKELFPSTDTVSSGSKGSTPSSSTVGSPKQSRKKRPAPAPPKPARLEPGLGVHNVLEHDSNAAVPKNSLSYPLQSELDSKLSDEEKALLEGKQLRDTHGCVELEMIGAVSQRNSRRLIPLDVSLLEDNDGDSGDDTSKCDDMKSSSRQQRQYSHLPEAEEANVVYRRVLMPPMIDTPTHDANTQSHDRQLEKLKDNKEAQNRNRQSQLSANSSGAEDGDLSALYNKSAHGKWKRRKGPAPALPIPPRKVLQMLPLQEIRHELEIIEVQQQGLEKQGVILEKMIRDRCEGENGEPLGCVAVAVAAAAAGVGTAAEDVGDGSGGSAKVLAAAENVQNSKEVEDLILQLFELVNEKNELFRRQAELMYLRRQHRLEQEQADLEYEIRVLMAQPERNKTDTDKAREEALIARLVEVVQLRNEVIECLEMDRLREAEEDLSIKQRLELHTAQREGDLDDGRTLSKLSKKEKKKQKEAKKLSKTKKIDADKDADESELNADKQKAKKKKKKFLF